MKKILFVVLMALSASAAAREYDLVCKWADGTKEVYSQAEVWTATVSQGGTTLQLRTGEIITFSPSVQCKMVATKS